ncbi:MAG: glutamyl-tRNA reductase [Deltaproteobacteria bacterium]|nr:glutamyl-tRNA reductase [Deltaproteobacteria bacterium]MBP7290115.1 glutamyl-tRNA reductase [Nannocystaceae bacterium]
MSGDIIAVGLNHKSAPVELREQLAIGDEDHARVLQGLRERADLAEAMVVSTCNRVEIYAVPGRGSLPHHVMPLLAELQRTDGTPLHEHAFVRTATDAARHIFRVTASLESLVVGEPQILGQVKDAFDRAREHGSIGPVLDRCMSLAFKSAKRVRSETEIARGAANVSSVAVDLARSIFGELTGCMALVVGAGEMAEQAAVHLQSGGVAEIAVVNRSAARGEVLAEKVNGHYEPWDRLAAELVRADIVIASTGATVPVIDRALLKPVVKSRRGRPLFLVDIAVPRDVAADVAGMPQVFVYNVDDLQQIVHDNMRSRRGEAERAAAMVEEEVAGFLQWLRTRTVGPMLGQLQAFGREVAEAELRKVLPKLGALSPEQQAAVEQLARAVVQKLLHRPMASVRKAGGDGAGGSFDAVALAEALAQAFELQEPAVTPVPSPTPAVAEGS